MIAAPYCGMSTSAVSLTLNKDKVSPVLINEAPHHENMRVWRYNFIILTLGFRWK
jgi:hypothetical protein